MSSRARPDQWQVGRTEVNYLVLAVITRRFRAPLIWNLAEGRGCSETNARIALINRYLDHFPATTIRMLLAEREFTGTAWLKFLNDHNIPFAIRLKESLRVTTEDGHALTLRAPLPCLTQPDLPRPDRRPRERRGKRCTAPQFCRKAAC